MTDLKDKIVLVTGAAGAIGAAVVAAVRACGRHGDCHRSCRAQRYRSLRST